eukprot:1134201-Pelagomonas_calceolata.AAC.5
MHSQAHLGSPRRPRPPCTWCPLCHPKQKPCRMHQANPGPRLQEWRKTHWLPAAPAPANHHGVADMQGRPHVPQGHPNPLLPAQRAAGAQMLQCQGPSPHHLPAGAGADAAGSVGIKVKGGHPGPAAEAFSATLDLPYLRHGSLDMQRVMARRWCAAYA